MGLKYKVWKVKIGCMDYAVQVIDNTLMSYSFGIERFDHAPTHEDVKKFILKNLNK